MWALIQYELYPYRKRRLRHRYTQGKSSEDNRRRWPSPNQGEASEQKWSCQHLQFSSKAQLCLTLCVQLFATPWATACQASLSITSSWSLLKLMSIESVIPSYHLILCGPLLLLPSIIPSIRVFSNESVLHIRWPHFGLRLQFSRTVKKYFCCLSHSVCGINMCQGSLRKLIHYWKTIFALYLL